MVMLDGVFFAKVMKDTFYARQRINLPVRRRGWYRWWCRQQRFANTLLEGFCVLSLIENRKACAQMCGITPAKIIPHCSDICTSSSECPIGMEFSWFRVERKWDDLINCCDLSSIILNRSHYNVIHIHLGFVCKEMCLFFQRNFTQLISYVSYTVVDSQ